MEKGNDKNRTRRLTPLKKEKKYPDSLSEEYNIVQAKDSVSKILQATLDFSCFDFPLSFFFFSFLKKTTYFDETQNLRVEL